MDFVKGLYKTDVVMNLWESVRQMFTVLVKLKANNLKKTFKCSCKNISEPNKQNRNYKIAAQYYESVTM